MTFGWLRQRLFVLAALCAPVVATGVALPFLTTSHDQRASRSATEVQAASRDSVTITSPVSLLTSPQLDLERGTIFLARSQGFRLSSVDSPETQLASGSARLVLDGAMLTLDQSAAVPAGASSGAPTPAEVNPFIAAIASLGFETITVRDTTLVIKSSGGEEVLKDVNAVITSKGRKGVQAKGKLTLRGAEIDFDAKLGAPTAASDAVALRLRLSSAVLNASLDGQLKFGKPLQITSKKAQLSVSHLREAARWLGTKWSDGSGLDSFEANGPFEWTGDSMSFENAEFNIDGNEGRGGLSIKLTHGRPAIEGTLAFDVFELAPYLGDSLPSGSSFVLGAGWMPFLSLWNTSARSIIQEINGDIRMSATQALYSGSEIGSGAASISMRDGVLSAQLTEIELAEGGDGDAMVVVDMQGREPQYRMSGRLTGCELSTGIAAVLGPPLLKGTGDATFALAAKGSSQDDILASLDGKIGIEMQNGGAIGLDAGALLRAVSVSPQNGWGGFADDMTPLETLSVRMVANGGVFTTEKLTASASNLALDATGTVNVRNRTLDIALSVSDPVELDGALAGPGPVAQVIEMRGSWFSPSIRRAREPSKAADVFDPTSTNPAAETPIDVP